MDLGYPEVPAQVVEYDGKELYINAGSGAGIQVGDVVTHVEFLLQDPARALKRLLKQPDHTNVSCLQWIQTAPESLLIDQVRALSS